ncbi:MAG: NAD(P)-dependent oxidoreductase [Blastocatellia bacterium]|nr:NAD(P)-dependent oxidoreductase [Blastocatellia bacterium]MBN8725837.1 NAD(P)-dependent oxidoreductase [Acidobacteriota bacterium]
MKTYLVTGANGYIGANLVKRLIEENNQVLCLVRISAKLDLLDISHPKIKIYYYDGTVESLCKIFVAHPIDAVFHLAAISQYKVTSDQVSNLIAANISFGTQLLELMAEHQVKTFINTGSYWQHLHNSANYEPVCLYAATKQAFEAIIDYYVQIKKVNAITLKLFDVYGPKDPRNKILQLLYNAAISQKAVNFSPGQQLLDLIYIDDVIDAYFQALKIDNSEKHLRYFVGSFVYYTLQEVAELYQNILGKKIPVVWGGLPYRQREVMKPCNGEKLPNWQVKTNLKDGLNKVICWQLQN